jgi:acyl-coenzyme A synthetase/AMP-(fatty) acid ligase
VTGLPNPITGQIVFARIKLRTPEPAAEFRIRLREFCRDRLDRFKIPQKIELVDATLHGERFKKLRRV